MWTAAPRERLWERLADPAHWACWAPHIVAVERPRGCRGPVVAGEPLVVHGPLGVRLHATVTRVDPGSRWDWRATPPGPWSLVGVHEILDVPRPDRPGHRVRVSQRIDGPLAALADRTALLAYAPLAELAVRRLASQARSRPRRFSLRRRPGPSR